ncbi:MAG: NAD(P)/FAD-dependent oxidoreductase, partial [Ilumatobacteraceae bacterium]
MPATGSSPSDVLIVGAGPAGTAAAITAAEAGLSVTLVDKARFPRDKCCGDGLTTLALRHLDDLGLDPSTITNWFDVDGAWLRSPSGREVFVPLPSDGRFAAVVPRLDLDDALVQRARSVGVDVVEDLSFVDLEQHVSGVAVTFDDGSTRDARWLVAADGMWSPIRRSLGMSPGGYLGEWHAFRQYVSNVSGSAASRLHVWFDRDLLPGYAWSFPLPGNRANVGFGILRDGTRSGKDMKRTWDDLLQRHHLTEALGPDAVFEGRHTAWP